MKEITVHTTADFFSAIEKCDFDVVVRSLGKWRWVAEGNGHKIYLTIIKML